MIIGIGVDLIEIGRIRKVFERRGERFKKRVFDPIECEYCEARANPIQHYAARFTAKEAFSKAIGTGMSRGIGFKNIVVKNDPQGKPQMLVNGKAKEVCDRLGAQRIYVSLSHSEKYATAVVVVEGNQGGQLARS